MQPKKIVFWDWNGTLLDDVEFTRGCLNWLLEQHDYPQRYDLAAYREVFGFPIEAYYQRAGFDFSRHPYPVLARRFMDHYNAGMDCCAPFAQAADTLSALAQQGWSQVVLSASRQDYLIEQVSQRGLAGYFTELLGLQDIYGASKVQRGLTWLPKPGYPPGTLRDGGGYDPRCRGGKSPGRPVCFVHRRPSIPGAACCGMPPCY